MSDQHKNSRKMLTFNTGAFGISSIAAIGKGIVALFSGSLLSLSGLALLILLAVGLPNFFGAWKAFGNMEYGKAQRKGFISWLSVAGVVLLDLLV